MLWWSNGSNGKPKLTSKHSNAVDTNDHRQPRNIIMIITHRHHNHNFVIFKCILSACTRLTWQRKKSATRWESVMTMMMLVRMVMTVMVMEVVFVLRNIRGWRLPGGHLGQGWERLCQVRPQRCQPQGETLSPQDHYHFQKSGLVTYHGWIHGMKAIQLAKTRLASSCPTSVRNWTYPESPMLMLNKVQLNRWYLLDF